MGDKGGLSVRVAWVMIIFILFSIVMPCVWADNDLSQKTISGRVDEIDWVKSIITVRYTDPLSGNTDEIDIIVPAEVKIMNGTETESFSDIEQSDPVTVIYYDDGLSGLKAQKIMDLNEGNRGS